jgi:uncharacterized protein YceH (UPF0502 family)
VLRELASRSVDRGGPLAVQLPRHTGERGERWGHLLSGEVPLEAPSAPERRVPASDASLEDDVERLKAEVARLSARVEELERIVRTRPNSSA